MLCRGEMPVGRGGVCDDGLGNGETARGANAINQWKHTIIGVQYTGLLMSVCEAAGGREMRCCWWEMGWMMVLGCAALSWAPVYYRLIECIYEWVYGERQAVSLWSQPWQSYIRRPFPIHAKQAVRSPLRGFQQHCARSLGHHSLITVEWLIGRSLTAYGPR